MPSVQRVVARYLEAKEKPTPNEASALSAFKWGHITREQLEKKIGKSRAETFAPSKKASSIPVRILQGLPRPLRVKDLPGVAFPYSGYSGQPGMLFTEPMSSKPKALAAAEAKALEYESSHWPGGMALVVALVNFPEDRKWVGVVNVYYSDS